MRRLLFILALLFSLSVGAHAQSDCVASGTFRNGQNQLAANTRLRVTPVGDGGYLVTASSFSVTTNASGVASFTGIQGATYNIQGPVLRFSSSTGSNITLTSCPTDINAGSTSVTVPSTGVAVQSSGTPLAFLVGTINFQNGLAATYSSSKANISLTTTGVTAGTCNACTLTIDAYGRITSAASGGSAAVISTLGDLLYGGSGGALTRLPGNTSATKKFLSQTGNGSISAAPVWDTITDPTWGNIGGTLSAQTDLQAALNAKQASLGYTAENQANKATGFGTLNNTLYPTVQAVANYAAANYQPLSSVLTTYSGIAPSANVQTL